VEAEWRRAKEELMPPKSSVKPEWTISSFGAIQVAGVGPPDRPNDQAGRQDSGIEPNPEQPEQTGRKNKMPARAPRRARR
jgi:hypothetical protein